MPISNYLIQSQAAASGDTQWFAAYAGIFVFVMIALVVWSLIWKAWALWIAARKGSKAWFVILLIFNTLGILEILYIFVFSKSAKSPVVSGSSSGPVVK
ncbi:MAG: DUF5652 family protein [Patescibacteria group bacterium]